MATIRPSPMTTRRRRHHHHEREHLLLLVARRARERDQGEVARVQHQLEAEQDHQRAAPDEHPAGADREQQRREDEVPGDVHQAAPSRRFRPPRSTIAPTAAIRRSMDVPARRRPGSARAAARRSTRASRSRRGASARGPRRFSPVPMTAIETSMKSAATSTGREALPGDRLPDRLLHAADVGGHEQAGPSPRRRRRRSAPRRRTRRRGSGTGRRARSGERSGPARCRTGCAAR